MNPTSWNGANAVEPTFQVAPQFTPPAAPREHLMRVRFTGSGSEYFRIWIVNLLLTLVTLGFYYPWAKVRRLRYFHGNTLVGGQPLDFHGDPKKMLRGYLLVGLMVVLYSVAGNFSPTAGLVALVIVASVWPALLKSSMQFRLANTSWRGLRFRFKGSVRGAYAALLPLFVPGLLIFLSYQFVPNPNKPPDWYGFFSLGVGLLTLLLMPWLWFNHKRYQHAHYALGQWQTELRTTRGAFYVVFLKTLGVALLLMVVAGALAALLFGVGQWQSLAGGGGLGLAIVIALVAFFIGMLLVQFVPRPYFTSRMQNLLWSRTGNRVMRFRSALRFRPLLGLTLKNWILMVLTLGLYWPFAAVATARMRLEAVTVSTRDDPAALFDAARAAEGEAAGDAAGDLLGFDIGL